MFKFTQIKQKLKQHRKWLGLLSVVITTSVLQSNAQDALVPANQSIKWKETAFTNFTVNATANGYQGMLVASYDTTKWSTNARNIIDNDTTNFATVRLVTYGSHTTSIINAESQIIISNNHSYNKSNLIQFTADVSNLSTGVNKNDIIFQLLTSENGIDYDTIKNIQKNEISNNKFQIGGYPNSNFSYVKIIAG